MILGEEKAELPTDPSELAKALVGHENWAGVKPAGLYSVNLTTPVVTGFLVDILQRTGKFGYLVYNRHRERWSVQYSSSAGGFYPEHEHAGCACAMAILQIWGEGDG